MKLEIRRIKIRTQRWNVSILCQHQELPDGTMCQMSHDVEAAKLVKMPQT